MVKKLIVFTGSTFALLLVTATAALAGSEIPKPGGSQVRGEVVTPPGAGGGALAFTGSQMIMLALAAAVILAIGISFVIASRRQAYSAR